MSRLDRYLVDIPALVYPSDRAAAHTAKVLNISLRGAMLECATLTPHQGDEVQIKLSFEKIRAVVSQRSISLKDSFLESVAENSVVRWTKPTKDCQFGIEFTNPKLDTLEFLSRLIRVLKEPS